MTAAGFNPFTVVLFHMHASAAVDSPALHRGQLRRLLDEDGAMLERLAEEEPALARLLDATRVALAVSEAGLAARTELRAAAASFAEYLAHRLETSKRAAERSPEFNWQKRADVQ